MDRTQDSARPPTVQYYRDSHIRVTEAWLVMPGRRYGIDELSGLRTVRAPREPLALHVAGFAVAVAAVLIAISLVVRAGGWLAAAGVLIVPLVVLVLGVLRRPRGYELWARYRGMTVLLLSEADAERYNRVCRAVMRAKEQAADR